MAECTYSKDNQHMECVVSLGSHDASKLNFTCTHQSVADPSISTTWYEGDCLTFKLYSWAGTHASASEDVS